MQPATVETDNRTIAGRHGDIGVRDYVPTDEAPDLHPLIWLHGGAFTSGHLDHPEAHAVASAIAAAGRPVTTVAYRLVPFFVPLGRQRLRPSRNRYPVPVDDVIDASADIAAREPGRPVALGGASAGACLAASAAIRMRDERMATPAALVLLYGTFHAQLPPIPDHLRHRVRSISSPIQFGPNLTRRMNLNYVGSERLLADPTVFPGTADVHHLPPTLLINSDRDTLRASGEAFADRLRAASVPVTETIVPGTVHGFFARPRSRGFREGVQLVIDWLNEPR